MHAGAGANLARASATDGAGARVICTFHQTPGIMDPSTQHYPHISEIHLCASQTMTLVAMRMFQTSQIKASVPRHPRHVAVICPRTRQLCACSNMADMKVTALMPDLPTKRDPARHMPTRPLAVSSRKRYCLVTGPRYCESPLCLERLLYFPSQSHPAPYHFASMRASLHTS